MGAAPAKFLFDLDFSRPDFAGGGTPDRASIAAAEERGYRSGFEAAQREVAAQDARAMVNALAQIGSAMQHISDGFAATRLKMESEAIDVALAAARKLAGSLVAAEPLAEVTALVQDCIRHLVATPHLAVRINDAVYDQARARLEEVARHSGFQGKLVILADPDVAGGDCRIEWADGGVVVQRAAVEAEIVDLVRRYMASRSSQRHELRTTP